nr:trichoplein keratin filament binding protein [Hymenolepis microstoma]
MLLVNCQEDPVHNALIQESEHIEQPRYEMDSLGYSNGKTDITADRDNSLKKSFSDSEASGDIHSEIQRNEHILDQKMDQLKNFDAEFKELDNIEREILDHQKTIKCLIDERKEIVESRLQRRFEKMLIRRQVADLKRRSRQVQDDLTSDLAWLDRLLALEGEVEGGQMSDVKKLLEEVLQREKHREGDMDDFLSSELSKMAKKIEEEWRGEAEARDKLLNDIIAECQDKLTSRLKALALMRCEREEEYTRLMKEIDAVKESSLTCNQLENQSADDYQPQLPSRISEKNNCYLNDGDKLDNNSEPVNEASNSKWIEPPVPNHRRKTQIW